MQAMLLTTALLTAGVAAENHDRKPVFVYPADGSEYVYNKLDTLVVTYATQHETAELYTYCDPGRETMMDRQTVPGFSASVPVLLNFTSDTPCWFDLRTGLNGVEAKSSAWFNVLSEERSTGPQTFGVDYGSPTPPTSTTSPSRTTTRRKSRRAATTDDSSSNNSNSSAPNPTPTPDSNSSPTPAPQGGEAAGGGGGMSYWAARGIGLGTGFGGAVLVGLFLLWLDKWSARRSRKAKEARERDLEERRVQDFYRRHPWSRAEDPGRGGTASASSPPGGQGEPGGRWFRDLLGARNRTSGTEPELGSTLNAANKRDAAEGDAAVGNSAQMGAATGTGDAS